MIWVVGFLAYAFLGDILVTVVFKEPYEKSGLAYMSKVCTVAAILLWPFLLLVYVAGAFAGFFDALKRAFRDD